MNNVVTRRPLADAIVALLAAATARPVGLGRVEDKTLPYAIVYPLAGGDFDGSLAYPETEAQFTFQVTSIGAREDQADWLADKVRVAILGRNYAGYINALTLVDQTVKFRRSVFGPSTEYAEGALLSNVVEHFAFDITSS